MNRALVSSRYREDYILGCVCRKVTFAPDFARSNSFGGSSEKHKKQEESVLFDFFLDYLSWIRWCANLRSLKRSVSHEIVTSIMLNPASGSEFLLASPFSEHCLTLLTCFAGCDSPIGRFVMDTLRFFSAPRSLRYGSNSPK